MTIDLDADLEESKVRWVYDVKADLLKVEVTSYSDKQVLELYKEELEELEEMILKEILHGSEIEQEEFDVSIE